MVATTNGCEMVWPSPIGSASSAYACERTMLGHEELTRDPRHGRQDALVGDPAPA